MGPFHWKNRFLRINEIKRIQSFEDKHIFLGSFKEQWRQIGNAVPPLLAFQFAKEIKKQYPQIKDWLYYNLKNNHRWKNI